MSDVRIAIAGCGLTRFGRSESATAVVLGVEAARYALQEAHASPSDVDALYFGTFASSVLGGQNFPAAIAASHLRCVGVPAIAIEGACASGSLALRQAVNLIRSGEAQTVLVIGAEKMTGNDTAAVTSALAEANDTGSTGFRAGLTFPGFFALLATAYLARYGVERDALADVAIKNRQNGASNPNAHFRSAVSRDEVVSSRWIAEPLRLFDCSPISDGAAALVVSTLEWAAEHCDAPVEILASEQAGGATSSDELDGYTSLAAAVKAARKAYDRAGIEPKDVSVAEVHDCFSIAEWIAVEDLGLVPRGEAAAATSRGDTALQGRIPVNPSGGLLSKGHPIGATGVAQVVELVRQLTARAANQIPGAELGLAHNVGGTGGVASVTLLARPR